MSPFSLACVPALLVPLLLALAWPVEAVGEGPPDPLVRLDGTKVATPADWPARRRELLDLLTREMYGRMPGRPTAPPAREVETDPQALGGTATRRQVEIPLSNRPDGPRIDLLIYLPRGATGPVPLILGMNFDGNHAVHPDPAIRVARNAADNPRAKEARRWAIEAILARGYGLATFHRGDIDPDTRDGFPRSIRAEYPDLQTGGDNFSVIAAWAWAYSRAIDFLATDPAIDSKRIALFGHSRLGKAALWAGANDDRVALVLANESGAGGAKLFHRGHGEDIRRLNTVFPHWFCTNFRQYTGRDTELPFDQHMVIALIAPRPVAVGSAQGDANADPEGEFQGIRGADPVYRFLGTDGLPADRWPGVDEPVVGTLGYHLRAGAHDVTALDWQRYLAFTDRHLKPIPPARP